MIEHSLTIQRAAPAPNSSWFIKNKPVNNSAHDEMPQRGTSN